MGDIDKKWARGFIDWILHTNTGRRRKLLEQGMVVSYLSQLSIVLNAAVRAEWLVGNLFMLLLASERGRNPKSKRQFLAIKGVMKFFLATECHSRIVKQVNLFSCYCGLRLNDMEAFRWKDIIRNDDRYMIASVQQKTSLPFIHHSRIMPANGCQSEKRKKMTRRLFLQNFHSVRPPIKFLSNGLKRPVLTRNSPTIQVGAPSER